MAKAKVLIDTSGFYALLVRGDSSHERAIHWLISLSQAGEYAVSTDYIVDETSTLLLARSFQHLLRPFFRMIEASEALSMIYVDEGRFVQAREHFLKHLDQGYSFTDCTSMIVMKELGIKTTLTKDEHFARAGFKVLLGNER